MVRRIDGFAKKPLGTNATFSKDFIRGTYKGAPFLMPVTDTDAFGRQV